MSPNNQIEWDEIDETERRILFTTMHDDDFDAGLSLCKQFGDHENEWIRRAVLLGLSHLARVHRKMDVDVAVPLLARGLEDESSLVRGQATDTLNELEVFLTGFTWEKHGFERPEVSPEFSFDEDDEESGDDEESDRTPE